MRVRRHEDVLPERDLVTDLDALGGIEHAADVDETAATDAQLGRCAPAAGDRDRPRHRRVRTDVKPAPSQRAERGAGCRFRSATGSRPGDRRQPARRSSRTTPGGRRLTASRSTRHRFVDTDRLVDHVVAEEEAGVDSRRLTDPPRKLVVAKQPVDRRGQGVHVADRHDEARSPRSTTSAATPTGVVTTALPSAIASSRVRGPASYREGITKIVQRARRGGRRPHARRGS